MAFQVSPGVQVREIDLTNVIPAVSTSIGGFAGEFNWGPAEEIRLVSSEKQLAKVFGTPSSSNSIYFLTAASFLQYGNALKVVRAVHDDAKNAAAGTALRIKNRDDYDSATLSSAGTFVARYPGTLGNSITVSVLQADVDTFSSWTYAGQFDGAPGTSDYAAARSASNDEMHIIVVDTDGTITGTPNTVLERFAYVSQASDVKAADGASNYYVDVINDTSNYVYFGGHATNMVNAGTATSATSDYSSGATAVTDVQLIGGVIGGAVTAGNLQTAYNLFGDAETVDVNLLFGAPDANGAVAMANYLIAIAAARKDIVAFVSPPIADSVGTTQAATDVEGWASTVTASSYGFIDSTALKVYDKYNDTYTWIGAAGHMAGLCASTDDVADPWFSPAGFTRGQILGITKIAFNPKQAERDALYKARINPIVAFPGQGTVLYGDKTAQAKPSAFDRINVRRLFIVLEKAIATAAKYQLFELNDEFTRAMFRNMVEPFLRDVKGRRGITDFAVICDETNNTGDIIDTNQFVADIYIKPARSINFITLNFIATRTGVEFSEIVG